MRIAIAIQLASLAICWFPLFVFSLFLEQYGVLTGECSKPPSSTVSRGLSPVDFDKIRKKADAIL